MRLPSPHGLTVSGYHKNYMGTTRYDMGTTRYDMVLKIENITARGNRSIIVRFYQPTMYMHCSAPPIYSP